MKRYIVDGYNMLFKGNTDERTFAKDRTQLISKLAGLSSLLNLTVTLVFDAHAVKDEGSHSRQAALQVVFTPHNVTADEWIQQAIAASDDPQGIVVITGDRPLAHKVRMMGAAVSGVDTFIDWLQRRAKNKRRPPKPSSQPQPDSAPAKQPPPEKAKIFEDPALQRYWELFNERVATHEQRHAGGQVMATAPSPDNPPRKHKKNSPATLSDEDALRRYEDIFEERWRNTSS